ncbi:MAG: hypothetical protein V7607_4486 [Solirubrobacteraceae bacterium]
MGEVSTLREEAEARARERIVSAFVDCIGAFGGDEFPLAVVAERAGVSERTIYRYYPRRVALLSAAAAWIHQHFFRFSEFTSLDDLPRVYREACMRFEERPDLAAAMAHSPRGLGDRAAFRQKVIAAHRRALEPLAQDVPESKVRLVLGILACLDNVSSWITMREELGLSSEEIADAVEWAITTLIADVAGRGRQTALRVAPHLQVKAPPDLAE